MLCQMFTRDDIRFNSRLPGEIVLTVTDVSSGSNDSVQKELRVNDQAGNAIEMKIWSKHNLSVDWRTGHRYRLSGVRGKT